MLGAQAAIENLKARKAAQHAQVAEAEGAIAATQADVERTQLEATRQRTLLATTYGTPQKVEQADADAKRFAATLARNQAELEAQRRQMAVLDTRRSQLRADAKAKQAALDLAKINLGYTRSSRRSTAMVSERGVRAGQYVHAGTPGHLGRAARQCLGDRELQGNPAHPCRDRPAGRDPRRHLPGRRRSARTVDSIAPASGSQFSLLPPDNATGNFTKVVQRIPVKLRLARRQPAGRAGCGRACRSIATILTDTTPPPP